MLRNVFIILAIYAISISCQEDGSGETGFPEDIDLNNPYMFSIANEQALFATSEYTKAFLASLQGKCSKIQFELVRILAAQTQVVAGELFTLHVEIKDSKCQSNCATKTCTFTTIQITWIQEQRLVESVCLD